MINQNVCRDIELEIELINNQLKRIPSSSTIYAEIRLHRLKLLVKKLGCDIQ